MPRLAPSIGLLAAFFLGGCIDSPRLNVRLLTFAGAGLPAQAGDSLRLQIHNAAGSVVEDTTFTGALGSAPVDLAGAGSLVVGETYTLHVRGPVAGCVNGVSNGRSMPFQHQEESYEVGLRIGCVDEIARTSSPPALARHAGELVSMPDGTVLVLGGASVADYPVAEIAELGQLTTVSETERFDPRTGMFSRDEDLNPGRIGMSSLVLPDGRVPVIGGTDARGLCNQLNDSYERPATPTTGTEDRCDPRAVYLPGPERVLVVGGRTIGLDQTYQLYNVAGDDFELLAASPEERRLNTGAAGRKPRIRVARLDERRALLLGCEVCPAILDAGASGSTSPEPVELEGDRFDYPGGQEVAPAACVDGGTASYMVGGFTLDAMLRLEGTSTEIDCYPDGVPGQAARVRRVGELVQGRSAPSFVVVGPAEAPSLVVFGGSECDAALNCTRLTSAEVVGLDPCTCGVRGESRIVRGFSLPDDAAPVGRAALLGDGTALFQGTATEERPGTGVCGEPMEAPMGFVRLCTLEPLAFVFHPDFGALP